MIESREELIELICTFVTENSVDFNDEITENTLVSELGVDLTNEEFEEFIQDESEKDTDIPQVERTAWKSVKDVVDCLEYLGFIEDDEDDD